jgi:hypothetical protein
VKFGHTHEDTAEPRMRVVGHSGGVRNQTSAGSSEPRMQCQTALLREAIRLWPADKPMGWCSPSSHSRSSGRFLVISGSNAAASIAVSDESCAGATNHGRGAKVGAEIHVR